MEYLKDYYSILWKYNKYSAYTSQVFHLPMKPQKEAVPLSWLNEFTFVMKTHSNNWKYLVQSAQEIPERVMVHQKASNSVPIE